MNRKALYWLCNAGGWLFYVLLLVLANGNNDFSPEQRWLWFIVFFFGLFFTHLYRMLIVRLNWLQMNLIAVIPRLGLMCIVFSVLFALLTIVSQLMLLALHSGAKLDLTSVSAQIYVKDTLGYLLIFALWTVIYFSVHYFLNYKKAEIENLTWQASITEIELNKLKSQLNPHFVFNCMNSIRALVDHEPAKAKEAVTQLANILRNTLMMGRNKLVPFAEEMKVVQDYLGLESIRLEERLQVHTSISPACAGFEVPPLMLQTLVENGIKHGIARLTHGGKLEITAHLEQGTLHVDIRNSGQYKGDTTSETGFGIRNTLQRLSLLYNGKASFYIGNESSDTVITRLLIPKL